MNLNLDWVIAVAVQVTLVSALSLVIAHLFLRRVPASRHAVLACALFVVAFSPLWIKLAEVSPVRIISVPSVMPRDENPSNVAVLRHLINPGAREKESPVSEDFSWISAAWIVWLPGVVFLSSRQCACWIRASRGVRASVECEAIRDPSVRVSDMVIGPMSVGLFRPIILLPRELARSLSHRQLQQVIEHERAHRKRGDHFVAVVQRIVAIVFWPHPLIHLLNRALDRAREEACDNAVLSESSPAEYSRALLQISRWMRERNVALTTGAPALALLGRWDLSRRIEDLLDERRNRMTRARLPIVIASLIALASVSLLVSCSTTSKAEAPQTFILSAAAAPTTQPGDLRPIKYTIGDRDFFNGDDIQIKQVRCTSDKFTPGEIIEVTGTYNLQTTDAANLHLYLTASSNEPHAPELVDQGITAKRGKGEFRLRETLSCVGWPHVTFYSNKGGKAFGGVYFGEGEWLLAKRGWNSSEKNAAEVKAEGN